MIGLDTNVIVRFLVQDDPNQSKKANQAIEKWKKEGKTLWICHSTLCEIFWVLERCYKLSRSDLTSILKSLLQTKQIKIEDQDVVWKALVDYETSKKVGFPDCLIGRKNQYHECVSTYTFDKEAAQVLPLLFKLL